MKSYIALTLGYGLFSSMFMTGDCINKFQVKPSTNLSQCPVHQLIKNRDPSSIYTLESWCLDEQGELMVNTLNLDRCFGGNSTVTTKIGVTQQDGGNSSCSDNNSKLPYFFRLDQYRQCGLQLHPMNPADEQRSPVEVLLRCGGCRRGRNVEDNHWGKWRNGTTTTTNSTTQGLEVRLDTIISMQDKKLHCGDAVFSETVGYDVYRGVLEVQPVGGD